MAATKRRLKRNPSGYKSEVHGRTGMGGSPPDDHTLNETLCAISLQRPRYKEGPLLYRPFPYPLYDDPATLGPGRTAPEGGHYSEWQVATRAVSFIGVEGGPRHTFNLYHPLADKEEKQANPYSIFFKACKAAYDGREYGNSEAWKGKWNALMKGRAGKGPAIQAPSNLYFSQAAVFANGDQQYVTDKRSNKPLGLADDDPLPIVQLKVSAGKALVELLDERKDSFEGDEDTDFSVGFVFGDPVGRVKEVEGGNKLIGGRIIEVFNPSKTKHAGGEFNSSWDGKPKEMGGYEVMVHKEIELNGLIKKASMSVEDVKRILDIVRWWFDDGDDKGLLYFPPYEEQAVWMAQAYQTIPGLLAFAWADNPEFMTDDVKGILKSRVTSVVPGSGEDDEEDEDRPRRKGTKDTAIMQDDDDDEGDEKPTRKKRRDDDEDDDDEDDAPVIKKKRRDADDEDDDEDDDKPARSKKRDDDDDDDDEDDEPVVKKNKKKVEEDDDEDDEPAPKKGKKKVVDEDDDEDDDEDEDDAEEAAAAKKKKKREEDDEDKDVVPPPPKRKGPSDDEDDDEDEDEDEDEDDEPVVKKPKKKVEEDDDEDDEPVVKKNKKKAEEEDEDDEPAPKKGKKKVVDEDDDDPDDDSAPLFKSKGKSDGKGRTATKGGDEFEKSTSAVRAARNSAKRNAPSAKAPTVKPSGLKTSAPAGKKRSK